MNGESTSQVSPGNELKRKPEHGAGVGRTHEASAARPAFDQVQGPEKKKLKADMPSGNFSSHINNSPQKTNDMLKHTTPNNKVHSPLNHPIKRDSSPVKHSPKKELHSPEKHAVKKDPHAADKQPIKKEHRPPITMTIKKESISPTKSPKPKASATESDDDDDVPLSARTVSKIKTVKAKPADNATAKTSQEKKSKAAAMKHEKDGKSSSKSASEKHKDKASKTPEVKKKVDVRIPKKKATPESDEDDEPLAGRFKKIKQEKTPVKKSEKKDSISAKKSLKRKKDADDSDEEPLAKTAKKKVGDKKIKKEGKDAIPKKKVKKEGKQTPDKGKTKAQIKKEEEENEVWKWWEEEPLPEGIKWRTLEHKGPYFPPPYEQLPRDVKFYYDGDHIELSAGAEEVAGFYAKMLDHDYTTKEIFNNNFFEDWRKEMTADERKIIKSLKKCNFKEMHAYFVKKSEERKNWTKEQKLELKLQNEEIQNEYGYCMMDGHKEKVGNFKIEPPGLFRGRGDHPKQGKLKQRIRPEDILINIAKDAKVPPAPDGHKWKAIQHDNKVTWLACWIENIQGSYKYVMLNPTSRIKGEKDWQKYETARKLKNCVDKIRAQYMEDWRSKEMRIRQRGVALYFIDKLALRAGHEKDEETADTVGCCSLRVEHIKLHPEWEDKEFVVEFDFLGKDSVRYQNWVPVEKRVYKNLQKFLDGKQEGDDLFDRLTTTSVNKHLSDLMDGLTAKVFRTYNASHTLQEQLNKLTNPEDNTAAKILAYNRANRAVAILCNHQRAVPKTFDKTMSNLQNKITEKKKAIKAVKKEAKELKAQLKERKNEKTKVAFEKKKAQVARLEEQLFKLEMTVTDKEENKDIALGTSKLNYLDPRISVAWCKKFEVPIEKVYSKTHRQKFAWAIAMAEKDFQF